jgi:AcrR family transcriptional regulator
MTIITKWSLMEQSMPKHFSEIEKQIIKNRILENGKELFEKNGIKKTSIDKIVEMVGIAKGSFYNFYASKEAMVYELILMVENKMHEEEMKNLNDFLNEHEFPEALRLVMWNSLEKMEEHPLLKSLSDPQLMSEIWNKLSDQEKDQGYEQDQKRVTEFVAAAKQNGYDLALPSQVFNSVMMSIFTVYMNKDMVGEAWEETIELMMTALFEKLFIRRKDEAQA